MHTNRCGNTSGQKCPHKEAEKKLQYKSSLYTSTEIQRMWNVKRMIIGVIIAATEILTKGLKKCSEAIPGKYSRYSLQKTAVLAIAHNT
jgi:hypothetical protein